MPFIIFHPTVSFPFALVSFSFRLVLFPFLFFSYSLFLVFLLVFVFILPLSLFILLIFRFILIYGLVSVLLSFPLLFYFRFPFLSLTGVFRLFFLSAFLLSYFFCHIYILLDFQGIF